MLDAEIKFFDEHWEEWEAANPGKYVLIKGAILLGIYDTLEAAVDEGLRRFYPGHPFLVQPLDAHEREVHSSGITPMVPYVDPSHRIERRLPHS
jgi:hypothetical protein